MAAIMMNDRMSFAIDYFDDAIDQNLNDVGEFLNNTADVSVVNVAGCFLTNIRHFAPVYHPSH